MVKPVHRYTVLSLIVVGLGTGCADSLSPAALADVVAATEAVDEEGFGDGQVWKVGPDRDLKTPSAVADRVGDGDVVLIDAATYKCDVGVVWRADRLTLKGVGGQPLLDAEGCDIPGGKGIWDPVGTDLLIDNIAFTGASVYDTNGAGIRFEGSGRVIIRNAFFYQNENGILFTPAPGNAGSTDLVIEHSEFAYNGYDSGRSHNLYIDGARSLTFRYNYSHDSRIGHLLKSRARSNFILYNRLSTMAGTGSFEIDIPNGGDSWIIGNIIQQGPESVNRGIIAYGAEAAGDPNEEHPDGHLYVVGNTIINDHSDGADLIPAFGYNFASMHVANNLLVGIPEIELDLIEEQGGVLDGNLITEEPGFRDRASYNYALTASSPAIDAAGDPGQDHLGQPLLADQTYLHPADVRPYRQAGSGRDVGALEFSEGSPDSPSIQLGSRKAIVDYGADAELDWTTSEAMRCVASGGWSGTMPNEGSASVGPVYHADSFTLTCEGEGGTAVASVDVEVTDHPLAAGYPDYKFVELPGTTMQPLCSTGYPYELAGDCGERGLSAAYVPDQNAYYLFGGAERSYFGNEVISLGLDGPSLSVVFGPTDPRQTENFRVGHEGAWDMIQSCRGVWDLKDGGVVPAPSRVYSSWLYAPTAGKILKNSGLVACGQAVFDSDSWWFDPYEKAWQLRSREGWIESDGSHAVHDPDTGQIFILSENAIYRFDPATDELVKLGSFNDIPWATTPVLDPVNDVILIIGNGYYQESQFTVIDIRGVDADATSLPGQAVWTATGDLGLLDMESPGLAYDSDRNVMVGWGGGDKLYFLNVDREVHKVEFITKTLDQPPAVAGPLGSTFLYAKKEKAFVTFTGAASNFYLLRAAP